MSFGGFPNPFSSSSSSSSSTPSPPQPPSTTSSESAAIKARLQSAITMQSNIMNAKYLISKVNETCFQHCVSSPGSSLSSKEQGCLSACMEKYIDAWNVTSRTYIGRLQKEGASLGIMGAGGQGGAPAEGKELF